MDKIYQGEDNMKCYEEQDKDNLQGYDEQYNENVTPTIIPFKKEIFFIYVS